MDDFQWKEYPFDSNPSYRWPDLAKGINMQNDQMAQFRMEDEKPLTNLTPSHMQQLMLKAHINIRIHPAMKKLR